jgi:shikimate dehydrogenase
MIRAAVLGQDVSRSRSPQIHKAAFEALGLEGQYEAFSVQGPAFRRQVKTLIADGFKYVNVTIPHKRLAANMATQRSAAVDMTGAANTLVFRRKKDGGLEIFADNTDGEGLLDAMADIGVTLSRKSKVVMVGAGGAAAGALLALVRKGANVVLLARRRAPAAALKKRLPEKWQALVQIAVLDAAALEEHLANTDLLISAVPAAAWEDPALLAAVKALPKTAAAIEMAYGNRSPLSLAVRKRTPRYQDGLPMLVHQAAHAVNVALRKRPPTEPMFRAART